MKRSELAMVKRVLVSAGETALAREVLASTKGKRPILLSSDYRQILATLDEANSKISGVGRIPRIWKSFDTAKKDIQKFYSEGGYKTPYPITEGDIDSLGNIGMKSQTGKHHWVKRLNNWVFVVGYIGHGLFGSAITPK